MTRNVSRTSASRDPEEAQVTQREKFKIAKTEKEKEEVFRN